MTLKELGQHFTVRKWHEGNVYTISSITEEGKRFGGGKYLWYIKSCGKGKFMVEGFEPTSKVDQLVADIKEKVASLPYDSEYYMYGIRKGSFEELIIHDYLTSLGFKCKDEIYTLNHVNIYGDSRKLVSIGFNGLSCDSKAIPENVDISILLGDYSWICSKASRDVEAIKKTIDTLLIPLVLENSVSTFKLSEKLLNTGEVDITKSRLTATGDLNSVDYKAELKSRLLALAESL